MHNGGADLVVFLSGLAHGRPAAIPRSLHRLARLALGRRASPSDVDDLVGGLLLRLWSATKDDRPGSARHLLAIPSERLAAVLLHRLRQLAAEQYPSAKPRKQLRSMIKAVLGRGVAAPPVMAPDTIYTSGKLSFGAVQLAVAWVLAQPEPPRVTVRDVAAELMARYPMTAMNDAVEAEISIDETVSAKLDAAAIARDIDRGVGSDVAAALRLRGRGATLGVIARTQGISTSTAHARLERGIRTLQQRARRGQLTIPDFRSALAMPAT